MPTSAGPRTATEIRTFLKARLNQALRRSGMFGGEIALHLLIDHVSHAEGAEDEWARERQALSARGASNALGVTGAVRTVLPGNDGGAVASVFTEFAHDQGWLELDRTLTCEEYAHARRLLPAWTAHDRMLTDVHETFGPPSILLGGTNPYFGKALAYVSERASDPMIFFHLWNEFAPDGQSPLKGVHSEPVLLAVRYGRTTFRQTFHFTPEGIKRRPCPDTK